MIYEILTGIKILSVSSFCSVIVVYLSLFRIQFRQRAYIEFPLHFVAWNDNSLILQWATQNRKPEAQGFRQIPEYPKFQKKNRSFRAHLTAF